MATKKPKAPPSPVMVEIEEKAKFYADLRARLDKCVAALKDGLRKVQDKHVDDLRSTSALIGTAHDELLDLVKAHPELFEKPKSAAFHGVTVGFKKEKGSLDFEDPAKVVERIEKHMPGLLDDLAPQGDRKLSKTELAKLPAADLKKLGVTVTADEDAAFVKGPTDAIDKWVDQMLSAYLQPEQEGAN